MTLQRVDRLREAGGEIPRMLVGMQPLDPERLIREGPIRQEFVAMLLGHSQLLMDAADALDDLHDRICGCDEPGRVAYCSFEEFAALVPLRADG